MSGNQLIEEEYWEMLGDLAIPYVKARPPKQEGAWSPQGIKTLAVTRVSGDSGRSQTAQNPIGHTKDLGPSYKSNEKPLNSSNPVGKQSGLFSEKTTLPVLWEMDRKQCEWMWVYQLEVPVR